MFWIQIYQYLLVKANELNKQEILKYFDIFYLPNLVVKMLCYATV